MRSAFRVIRTVREKHACTKCDAIVQAPRLHVPSSGVSPGAAGGYWAQSMQSIPRCTASLKYSRQGVELSRSLLLGWVDACCRLLSPLEEAS